MTDDHRLWPKDAPDQPQQMPTPLPQKTWQKIGERMQTELDLRDKEAGDGADALKQQVKAANRSRRSYRDFLRRFCVLREEVKLDPDEFDLNFYTYGLSVYGNLPSSSLWKAGRAKRSRSWPLSSTPATPPPVNWCGRSLRRPTLC